MEGESDPTALACRYCGAAVEPDGAGRLWEFTGRGHRWVHTGRTVAQGSAWSGGWEYTDDSYSDKCPVSPTFRHETGQMSRTAFARLPKVAGYPRGAVRHWGPAAPRALPRALPAVPLPETRPEAVPEPRPGLRYCLT